jgi:hypothetical protein
MIDTEKANICTVMNTFGFDLVSGGPAIRRVVQFFKLFDSRRRGVSLPVARRNERGYETKGNKEFRSQCGDLFNWRSEDPEFIAVDRE